MNSDTLSMLINKKNFVDQMSYVLCGDFTLGVAKIQYEVWISIPTADEHISSNYREILKITFDGGAFLIRTVTGDSHLAIVQEIAKYLAGGYYDEVIDYNQMIAAGSHKQII